MKKRTLILITLAAGLLFSSCESFLEEEPESFLSAESEEVDANLVEAELQGAYKALIFFRNDRPSMIGILGTDEAQGATVEVNYWAEQGALDKYNTSLNSDNWLTKWLWDAGYFSVSRANTTIRAARNVSGVTPEWKASKEAEARFVRAVAYFMLAQYFGDVPLITEDTKPSARPNYPREAMSKIYEYIVTDLTYAEKNLQTDYRAGRATIGAAKAMLMKVYMYAQPESGYRDLGKAKTKFEEIEDLNQYVLQPNYGDLFKVEFENGTESVYEFQFEYPDLANNLQYFSGCRAIGQIGEGGGYEIYLPTQRYLNLFTEGDGDERYEASFRTEFYLNGELITSAGDPEYIAPHCKKYEDPRDNNAWNSAKNVYYIRYADLILLYAECLNAEGNVDGAKTQVKRIRDRAKVTTPITANTQEEMLDYIYEERMRELGMEGWRRFDLIRRGPDYFVSQVDQYNKFAKGNVQEYHSLYPIPSNEISMNEGIGREDQNPGYN